MKKYILILFSIISLWSCKETEDESIDITVLPSPPLQEPTHSVA